MTFDRIGDLWRSDCRRYHVVRHRVTGREVFDALHTQGCSGTVILRAAKLRADAEAACLAHAAQNPTRAEL